MHNRAHRLFAILALLAAVCMLELSYLRNPAANVSAVAASGSVGVYWDATCTRPVYSIQWGVLPVGEAKNVVVYARNEGTETIFLAITTSNFAPTAASGYLNFAYGCVGHKTKVNQVVKVTLSLVVTPRATGNSTFSFDMNFEGRQYVVADLNGDGLVNLFDAVIFASAYGSTPQDTRWNADADLKEDSAINIFDAVIFAAKFRPS